MADPAQLELLEHYRITRARSGPGIRRRHEVDWVRKDEIGRGSVGTVYLETEARTGATRAVKEVRKSPRIDFKAELIALTRLAKPAYSESFGRFLGWWETDTLVGFVLEYFEHGDLRSFIQEPWLEQDSKDVAGQLLSGLKLMHADGFTHRDLKPENVFVVHTKPVFKIKIGDFGVSKRVNSNTLLRTQVGTRLYMAPEVLDLFDDEIDGYTESVDIWAVGVVIFETISSRRPFTDFRSLKRYCKDDSVFPAHLLAEHNPSAECHDFLRALLASTPSGRPSAEAALESAWLISDSAPSSPDAAPRSLVLIPRIIVGIEFGVAYTRASWAVGDGLDTIRLVNNWPGLNNAINSKVPSVIAYKDGNVSTWGHEASEENSRVDGLILLLDPNLERPLCLPALAPNSRNSLRATGKPAVQIVSDYLRNVRQAILDDIQEHLTKEHMERFEKTFVITVPTGASDLKKDNTLNAAKMAGLHPIDLIKESEAAAIYALHMLHGEDPKANQFEVSDAFLFCEVGRAEVDIFSYTIKCFTPYLELEELVSSIGSMSGSYSLHWRFIEAIKKLVGEDQHFRLVESEAFIEAMDRFTGAIVPVYLGDDDKTYYVSFPLADLEDNEEQGLKRDVWSMKGKVVKDIFAPTIQSISSLIRGRVDLSKQKRRADPNGDKIRAIILVGDFNWGEYLKKCLSESFPEIPVMLPKEPWCAAVKGTVLSQMPGIGKATK